MKYKLIKEYPGSPKLGSIIEEDDGAYYIPDDNNKLSFTELDYYPYVYPEFWEKVIEKDYEILSFKNIHNNLIYDKYQEIYRNETSTRLIGYCLEFYKIHSIKRLSDDEIFTIGDKIFPNNKIYKFELKDNILKIWHCDISFSTPIIAGPSGQPGNCSWIKGINNLKKIKQPLFKTEDGVEIFENDFYCAVNITFFNNYGLQKAFAKKSPDLTPFWQSNRSVCKYFSTKEKAEEYILLNKPCLSLKETLDILDLPLYKNHTSLKFKEKLKELVKQKLK